MRKRGRFEASPAPRPSWKTTNRHLQMMVTSAVSMLLCCTMLLGTTMAWFTDTITSSLNQITIGTLGIALYEGTTTNPDNRLKDGDRLFSGSSKDGGNTAETRSAYSWGPDYYQTKVLTVENTGDLELIFELRLLSGNPEVITAAKDFEVYVRTENVDQVASLATPTPIPNTNGKLENVLGPENHWEPVGNLGDILTGEDSVFQAKLAPADSASGQSKQSFAIALRMTSAGNSTQGSSLTLDIQLFAYQSNATGVVAPPTTQKTAVIYEVDDSEDTEELKPSSALNSVLKSPSVSNNQITNTTENTSNQNVTNNNNSGTTDGDDDGDQVPGITDDDDDGDQVPNSGTTNGGNDDDQSSGTTGGNDNGTVVPDSGTTDGNNNGAQVPDSSSTGGDDDSIPVPNSDTTGGDDVTPEPDSGGQNGSETDSSQGTDNSTSVE